MFNSIQFNAGKFNATNKNPKTMLQICTDSISNVEVVSKKIIKKFVSDTVTHTEKFVKLIIRKSSDSVTHTEKFVKLIARKATEAVTHTEGISRLIAKKMGVDNVSHTDFFKKNTGKMAREVIANVETLKSFVVSTYKKTRGYVRASRVSAGVRRVGRSISRIMT